MSAVEGYSLVFIGWLLGLAGCTGAIITAAVRRQPGWSPRVGVRTWLAAAAVGMGIVAYFMVPVLLAPG